MDLAPELRSFLIVAEKGSLSAAADQLGVPRSTISRRLARLEAHVGDVLLERTTRHVRITEAGELLHARAAPLLADIDDVVDEVRELSGAPRGTLRVCVPPGLGREFLGEFLLMFHERYPDVRLDLSATSQVPTLADGFDVALRDDVLADSPWIRHPLGPADRMAVASAGYLAAHGSPGGLADLASHRIVSHLPAGDTTAWPLRDGTRVEVDPILRVDDLETLRGAVDAGLGIGLLPFYMVAFDLTAGRLMPVLPALIGNERTLVALFPPGRRRSPKIRAFLDALDGFAEAMARRRDGPEA